MTSSTTSREIADAQLIALIGAARFHIDQAAKPAQTATIAGHQMEILFRVDIKKSEVPAMHCKLDGKRCKFTDLIDLIWLSK